MSRNALIVVLTVSVFLTVPRAAVATNAAFQAFFFNVCANPTGALAARCAETTGGLGNISGDSESSLNPSQTLSSNDGPLSQARMQSKQARERGERRRDRAEEEGGPTAPGRTSLLFNARTSSYDSERVVDVDAERSLNGDAWGAEIGFDHRLGDGAFLGLLVGLEKTDVDFVADNIGTNFTPAASAGELMDDSASLTFFGSVNMTDSFFFEGSMGYVTSDFEATRNSVFQESNRVIPQTNVAALGKTDGDVTWAGINFGFDMHRNAVAFGPYFGATMSTSTIDAYTESDFNGSGLAMAYGDIERDSLISHLGFRVSIAKSTGNGVVLPQFRVEYEHESDDPSLVTASYLLDASATQYALLGDEPDRDQFEAAFGVAWVLPGGWQPFFDVEYLAGNRNLDRYRIATGFRVEF